MDRFKPDYCLNTQYAEHAEQIDDALDATRLDNQFDVVKFDELPAQQEKDVLFAAIQLYDVLGCQAPEAFDAVERAVHLALRVAIALSPGEALRVYFAEIDGKFAGEFPREQLVDEVRQYLDENPHIDGFIQSHLDEIDRTGVYLIEAEAACGIIFKWADQAIEVAYLNDNFTAS